jgi:transcription elongation factor Elf1
MQEEARQQERGGGSKPVITTTAREVNRGRGEDRSEVEKRLPVNMDCPNCGGSPLSQVTVQPDGSAKCEFCGQWYNVRRS